MSVPTLAAVERPPDQPDLAPRYFDTRLIVTPEDNPVDDSASLADLLDSMREHGQLVPGYVCSSPDLSPDQRLCLEGNRRLAAARRLGLTFWAFDLERPVPEAERIKLTFQHNLSRRVMGRDEIAARAARYIELTGCTQGEAALRLNVSQPTLSRAFGERRIPPELKPRAERLGLSIRSLVASLPESLMAKAVEFAETSGRDGRSRTRDDVSLFIKQLKKGGRPEGRKARTRAVTLRMNGRAVTLALAENDTTSTVADDLKAIAGKLGKHDGVPPDGWPFLFR